MRPGLTGSFFSVDVGRAQSIVQSDPWVADAKAERVPPHTIRIRVSEHKPFARWLRDNEHAGLVDDKGRIFRLPTMPNCPNLTANRAICR